jgi:hypothetical protein
LWWAEAYDRPYVSPSHASKLEFIYTKPIVYCLVSRLNKGAHFWEPGGRGGFKFDVFERFVIDPKLLYIDLAFLFKKLFFKIKIDPPFELKGNPVHATSYTCSAFLATSCFLSAKFTIYNLEGHNNRIYSDFTSRHACAVLTHAAPIIEAAL